MLRAPWAVRLVLAVGLSALAVALVPEPGRDELALQAIRRALAQDGAALFDAVRARAGERGGFVLEDASPAVSNAVAAALRRFDAATPPGARLSLYAEGELRVRVSVEGDARLGVRAVLTADAESERIEIGAPFVPPSRLALLPPLLAIALALLLRKTLVALLSGVVVGSVCVRVAAGESWWLGVPDTVAVYLLGQLRDSFRIEILGFVVALLAMIGVLQRGGAVRALVLRLARLARSVRSTLLLCFGSGLAVFFDDYSNCLLVGNTMRPLTDRLRISREKLAFIVDSTAAPVAGLSLLSTWVAFEISLFEPQLAAAGIDAGGYAVFVASLAFRFYSWFALAFVLVNICSGRDFGPMLRAERRARTRGELVRAGGAPMVADAFTAIEASPHARNLARDAVLPVALVLVVTAVEIFRAGGGFEALRQAPASLGELDVWARILNEGGGAGSLLAGALAGLFAASLLAGDGAVRLGCLAGAALAGASLAVPLTGALRVALAAAAFAGGLLLGRSVVALRVARAEPDRDDGSVAASPTSDASSSAATGISAGEIATVATASVRSLGLAIAILFSAWMIAEVCAQIGTADFLVALAEGRVSPASLPIVLFALAALISFATGTSWGTMSILLPNVVVLAATLGEAHPIGSYVMVLVSIGAVLEGSIFGDHCSPISDTTVLSSVASGSDHLDHVGTQLPYALLVAVAAVAVGYVPCLWPELAGALVPSFWLSLAAATSLFAAVLVVLGSRPPEHPPSPQGVDGS